VPRVPNIGLILKDLILCDDAGGVTTLPDGQINFQKMYCVTPPLEEFFLFQQNGYTLPYRSDIQEYLLHGRAALNEIELFKQSKFIESPGEKISLSLVFKKYVI